MQQTRQSSSIDLFDPRAAAIFTDSNMRRLVMLFIPAALSISEAARLIGSDVKRLHHHVTKLHRLGLLEIEAVQQRKGRPIKRYRAAAARFFVPLESLPWHYSTGLVDELSRCIAGQASTTVAGIVFSADEHGRPVGDVIEIEGTSRPAPMDNWRILQLAPSSFRQLKADMTALLDRYQELNDSSGDVYLVHAGAARRLQPSTSTDNQSRR